jgi:predicted metalloendopeptidase
MVFQAAILQPPFFNIAEEDVINYGGIGAVICHIIIVFTSTSNLRYFA